MSTSTHAPAHRDAPAWRLPQQAADSGVWQIAARQRAATLQQLSDAGIPVTVVSCARVLDKDALLARIAATLGFPAWFGNNWDALLDCLSAHATDAVPVVLVFDGLDACRRQCPTVFATLIDVLIDAATRHAADGRCFQALIPLRGRP